ncbi:bifunctional folylpolyglutamate synthase/dihydrofolate synthase [Turneriella parva]|uniref:FolC bifunctional protein n=1 Tax=Turneriella parva (strain ATCC BAA-1111 / DSM 21527 / NCTC 11395 / H) TaxID=869212 RepID=I4B5E3_TURPD|nr:Mur ligase family protein [Turneriella parva]AFM12500.1 FolC bifunctional protein [Turneriella parva DSM 21527]
MNSRIELPDPAPEEKEILEFFSARNFERSRRFAKGAYDPAILRQHLAARGDPQFSYKTIHVAGTVGKGSTTNYLARGLVSLGKKTGTYLSPHFVSLKERILVNDRPITDGQLAHAWGQLLAAGNLETLSFFDAMTAMAFEIFADERVDYAVIETGLGGRLDSTNNLHSEFSVITRIGLDHQQILGDTIDAIAREKAGIIKPGRRVYTCTQIDAALEVLRSVCADVGSELVVIGDNGSDFTERNRHLAREILTREFSPDAAGIAAITKALEQPVFGRFSILRSEPRIIFDSGHNDAAMQALAEIVNRQPESQYNFFLNTMVERDLAQFFSRLAATLGGKARFFLFSMRSPGYYAAENSPSGIEAHSDEQISAILKDREALHVFAGSMGIYAELRARFGL